MPSGRAAPALQAFVNQPSVFGLPGILVVWAVIAVAMALLLRRTAFGFAIYAIGSNERAAHLLGLPVGLNRCLLYGASGLTGVCVIGYTGTSFISVGDQYVVPSIIAVVIGHHAMALMIARLSGLPLPETDLVMPTHLVVRRSTAPLSGNPA